MTSILLSILVPSALAEDPVAVPAPVAAPAPAATPAPVAAPAAAPAEPAPSGPPETFSQKYGGQKPIDDHTVRHGFRVGYVYANHGEKSQYLDSGHLFAIGYEAEFRIASGGPMDVLVVPNVLVLGLNQGVFLPTANLIVGASFNHFLEIGVGGNFAPSDSGKVVHMIAAVAITPNMGTLQLPLALSFVPDNDDDWRVGLTAGVNWGG